MKQRVKMKYMRQVLLASIACLAVLPIPAVRAEGGVAIQPYWTFPTTAPVTHVQTGDINGDGVPEVVIVTADKWVHVVENDGRLAWRYELETEATTLLVTNMDDNGQTAEIFVGGYDRTFLLSATKRPVWKFVNEGVEGRENITLAAFAADLNEDDWPELLEGDSSTVRFVDGKTNVRRFVAYGQSVIDVWAGEVDGDDRPEIVPSIVGGNQVYVLNDDFSSVWQHPLEGEVRLVQGGDVDGDGLAEIVALSASWELFLLESDGQQVWRLTLPVEKDSGLPLAGHLMIHDLDGDGRQEIIVRAPTAIYVFTGDGDQLWQFPLIPGPGQDDSVRSTEILEAILPAKTGLLSGDVNGDDQAEIVVASRRQGPIYLLAANGQRLAEYLVNKTTGALAYTDLNGDGQGEIMVGTEAGLQVFGAAAQPAEPRKLWQSPFLDAVTAVAMIDLNGDSRSEVIAGSWDGQVYALAGDGRILWQVIFAPEGKDAPGIGSPTVLALSAGDVDGDGQPEIIVNDSGKQIYLLDRNGPRWSVTAEGRFITGLAVHDLDGDGRAEIIFASDTPKGGDSVIKLLDGDGTLIWQQELAEAVTTVAGEEAHVLVGADSGRVYRLTAAGVLAGEYDLGARVLSLAAGQGVASDGRVYRLDEDGPTLIRELELSPRIARLNAETAAIITGEQMLSLAASDGSLWQGTVDSRALSLAIGDLNGDGEIEVAVGTDSGRVHLFGQTLDQPPFLTRPDLTETRDGYEYSVEVIDPEADTVPVTLEIWNPSANAWLAQEPQSLAEGQDRGELTWDISEPFDIWDSGQESRFRFVYDVGGRQAIIGEIPGPFNIPTTPWYLYYGQRVGLGALLLLVPALGLALYRRQRAYRRSPAGQAESLLKQLQAQPDEVLTKLHTLTNDNPSLLTYLSGAARQAGETALADLSAGHNMLLVRSEVTGEDLRVVIDAIRRLDGPSDEKKTKLIDIFDLFQQALEANTVNRIVSLSVRLHEQLTEVEAETGEALNDLNEVIKTLNNFQRVEAFEDKTAYLGQALEALGRLEREFRTGNMWQPEGNILARIAANWLLAVNNALQDLQGRAQLEATLKTRHLLSLDRASLSLELTNTGRSPASNVTVNFVPDQKFAVGNGTARLDVLAAGRSAVVELPISTAASVEQFRAEFNITFDDRERSGKSLAFADIVQLLRPTTKFQPMPNPYAPGTPLAPGSPIFFGRDDLFQFVGQNLAGLTRQNILVLIGQRRMGKTSFLQQLTARLGEEYLPVYLDGQSLGIDPGMANFFYDLALSIVDALVVQGIEIGEPEPEDFEERPSGAFERTFLPQVFEAIGERQLLLLFDEFEELEMRVTSGKLEATIFPFLRHLMQHNRKLGFIFVGTHRLEALSTDYWSIFFNIALYKHVVFLSETAARALITEPVAEHDLVYDDLALDKMLRVTAGHPYFLQLTCHALVNHANRERRGYLTIQDVNSVLDEMVELGEAHFAFLWEQSSPSEQLILSALTRLLGQEPTVTATQVVELLAERGITRDIQDVAETLRQLVERDVIREIAGQPPRYEYKVELVRLWIERYKAFGRVVEEVG